MTVSIPDSDGRSQISVVGRRGFGIGLLFSLGFFVGFFPETLRVKEEKRRKELAYVFCVRGTGLKAVFVVYLE